MNLKLPTDWKCIECGSSERKGAVRSMCKNCYARWRRRKMGIPSRPHWGKHKECTQCGSSPVAAMGLCKLCYGRMLEKKNLDKRKKQKYVASERVRFGGDYDSILIKSGGKCQICGMTQEQSFKRWNRKLDIHHKDGHGRTSSNPNHSLENLIVLCRTCHMAVHHPEGKKIGATA